LQLKLHAKALMLSWLNPIRPLLKHQVELVKLLVD
jgi:hypothetical protein